MTDSEEGTKKKGIAMSDIYLKVREARNFLSRMENVHSTPGDFVSDLQSFLSSAHSVTHAMQKQFRKKPDFKEWFKREQREMQSDEMLGFFSRIERVEIRKWDTLGKSPSASSITYLIEVYLQFPPHDGWRFGITRTKEPVWLSPGGYEFDASEFPETVKRIYIFEEPPRTFFGVDLRDFSVVFLCSLYLGFLAALVKEANEKFGERAS